LKESKRMETLKRKKGWKRDSEVSDDDVKKKDRGVEFKRPR